MLCVCIVKKVNSRSVMKQEHTRVAGGLRDKGMIMSGAWVARAGLLWTEEQNARIQSQ